MMLMRYQEAHLDGHVSLSMGGFDGQRHGHLATEQTGTADKWQQGLTSH